MVRRTIRRYDERQIVMPAPTATHKIANDASKAAGYVVFALLLPLLSACAEDDCAKLEPQVQVMIVVPSQISVTSIAQLDITIRAAGKSQDRVFSNPSFGGGRSATVLVVVGEAGKSGFELDVGVVARAGGGAVLGSVHEAFLARGDGCNRVRVTLQSGAPADTGVDARASRDAFERSERRSRCLATRAPSNARIRRARATGS